MDIQADILRAIHVGRSSRSGSRHAPKPYSLSGALYIVSAYRNVALAKSQCPDNVRKVEPTQPSIP